MTKIYLKKLKFEVTFKDEFKGVDEQDVLDQLVEYLGECWQHDDVTAFNIMEVK